MKKFKLIYSVEAEDLQAVKKLARELEEETGMKPEEIVEDE